MGDALTGPCPRRPGAVLEVSPAQEAFAAELGARIAGEGGAALLIDYGREAPGAGDTLQALKGHRKVSPLDTPGEADLTVHADFPAVAAAARAAGADARHPDPGRVSACVWAWARGPRRSSRRDRTARKPCEGSLRG